MSNGHETQINRRRFCQRAAITSAGLMLAATEVSGQKDGPNQSVLAYPPRKIEGAERLMPGSALYFDYPKPEDPAVLVRTMDGQFLAYSRRCAHLGCSVDFDQRQRCLVCPCHRGVYDSRTGTVLYGPAPKPLDQIVLQVRAGGEVWATGKRSSGDFNA